MLRVTSVPASGFVSGILAARSGSLSGCTDGGSMLCVSAGMRLMADCTVSAVSATGSAETGAAASTVGLSTMVWSATTVAIPCAASSCSACKRRLGDGAGDEVVDVLAAQAGDIRSPLEATQGSHSRPGRVDLVRRAQRLRQNILDAGGLQDGAD